MNNKEIMVNLMVEKVCEYIDAGDIHRIVVHGKEFAEVKKGKWIRGKMSDGKNVWYCSNCREVDDYYNHLANYCWFCGADMRGDDNETD